MLFMQLTEALSILKLPADLPWFQVSLELRLILPNSDVVKGLMAGQQPRLSSVFSFGHH